MNKQFWTGILASILVSVILSGATIFVTVARLEEREQNHYSQLRDDVKELKGAVESGKKDFDAVRQETMRLITKIEEREKREHGR
jgi:hypothetical protein